jgi:hypothetical protein
MGLHTRTYWLTDRQLQYVFDFDYLLMTVKYGHESRGTGTQE